MANRCFDPTIPIISASQYANQKRTLSVNTEYQRNITQFNEISPVKKNGYKYNPNINVKYLCDLSCNALINVVAEKQYNITTCETFLPDVNTSDILYSNTINKLPNTNLALTNQDLSGGYSSDSFDTQSYSIIDVLINPTAFTTLGNIYLQYSNDNSSWITDYSNVRSIDPSMNPVMWLGLRLGTRYVSVVVPMGETTEAIGDITFSAKYF